MGSSHQSHRYGNLAVTNSDSENKKLRVCVDYRKLNAITILDPFPISYTDALLDAVAGHKMYSFLDGLSGYNQIKMVPGDREKTAFIIEWGVYVSKVMTFGLKSAQATFQQAAYKIFERQLQKYFMRIFVDDFTVFGKKDLHLEHLWKTSAKLHNCV